LKDVRCESSRNDHDVQALRLGGKSREPGTPGSVVKGPERASSQIVIEKRDRGSFDDS
jgi:hypothetical protein